MSRLRLLAPLTLATAALAAPAAAQPVRPARTSAGHSEVPATWSVYSRCGGFLFVMRGASPDDPSQSGLPEKVKAWYREMLAVYPQSGLYNLVTGELLWATHERMEVRTGSQQHYVIVTRSGVVVWLSHQPVGPPMDPADTSAWMTAFGQQSAAPPEPAGNGHSLSSDGLGVRIMANGVTVGSWRPEEFIDRPEALDAQPTTGYTPWLSEAEVEGDRLLLTTRDEQKITIDLANGMELDRQSVRKANGTRWVLLAVGLLLVSSAGLALARKRSPTPARAPDPAPAEQPVAELRSALDDLVVTPPPPGLGRRRSGWHVPVRR